MTEAAVTTTQPRLSGTRPSWLVVAGQELRDLWLSGKGLALMLAYTTLLSISTAP